MGNAASFYTVIPGDTLSQISKKTGVSEDDLCKMNGIKDRNKIKEGQDLALNPEAVLKVAIQLLDRNRDPIKDLMVRLQYCGKTEDCSSGPNGRLPDITTLTPEDIVRIFVKRVDGTWKHITDITSGWGNKLVNVISEKIKIVSETLPHPPGSGTTDPNRKKAEKPDHPQDSTGRGTPQSDYGDGKGKKPKKEKPMTAHHWKRYQKIRCNWIF